MYVNSKFEDFKRLDVLDNILILNLHFSPLEIDKKCITFILFFLRVLF